MGISADPALGRNRPRHHRHSAAAAIQGRIHGIEDGHQDGVRSEIRVQHGQEPDQQHDGRVVAGDAGRHCEHPPEDVGTEDDQHLQRHHRRHHQDGRRRGPSSAGTRHQFGLHLHHEQEGPGGGNQGSAQRRQQDRQASDQGSGRHTGAVAAHLRQAAQERPCTGAQE